MRSLDTAALATRSATPVMLVTVSTDDNGHTIVETHTMAYGLAASVQRNRAAGTGCLRTADGRYLETV